MKVFFGKYRAEGSLDVDRLTMEFFLVSDQVQPGIDLSPAQAGRFE